MSKSTPLPRGVKRKPINYAEGSDGSDGGEDGDYAVGVAGTSHRKKYAVMDSDDGAEDAVKVSRAKSPRAAKPSGRASRKSANDDSEDEFQFDDERGRGEDGEDEQVDADADDDADDSDDDDDDDDDDAFQQRPKPSSSRGRGAGRTGSSSSSSSSSSARKGRGPGSSSLKKSLVSAKVHTDAKLVLSKVEELSKTQNSESKAKASLQELGILDAREVVPMEDGRVSVEIERIIVQAARSILSGEGLSYDVPSRAASNQLFVPELERIVLKNAVSSRQFANTSTVRKTAITTRVLQLVHEVLSKRIHITKRDLFYTDVKLFEKQSESDTVLDDIACMIGCTRTSLNVVASEKGVVIGRVTFLDDGDFIDCTKMGVGGKAIPSLIDRITNLQGDAKFVLLVEKDAAFMRLSEDRFYNQYPCIIITARGQPDVSTRLFLNMVKTKLNIPILGLVDSDPYGLKILSVYLSGSKNMSYDSASLTTSDVKWLGVRPSDLETYNIPKECRLEMSEADIKYGQDLLKEDFIKSNPEWMRELELMLKTKEKAEIQALSNFGFQYLTQTYLPLKLQQGDWI